MSIDNKILIEKKLRETLSAEEQDAFSSKLENDERFKEEYFLEKQLFENLNERDWNFIQNIETTEVQEYVELFQDEETIKLAEKIASHYPPDTKKVEPNRKSRKLIWFSGIAATILILLISVFTYMQKSKSPEELYFTYLDSSEILSLIPRGGNLDKSLVSAQDLFESKKYEDALIVFDELLKSNSKHRATILLYKGIAEMEIGNNDEAIKSFDMLIESNLIDATKGYWYKALLYLKLGDAQKAKVLLEKIKSEALYNHKKASDILEEL